MRPARGPFFMAYGQNDEPERGVAISLLEPLLVTPSVLHYEHGPLTYRQFKRDGQRWLAVYDAEHDGTGWLVVRARCRPLILLPGDIVHIMAVVEEDHGDFVLMRFEDPRGSITRQIPRGLIVFLHEHG